MSANIADGQIVDGKKEGYWITYFANGNKRSEGRYIAGKKEGRWVQYYQNGNKASKASFRNGLYEGFYTSYYGNGNRRYAGPYREHQGKSSDGRKEGVWNCYEEDGETIWRIITYKAGRRAKPDESPLGTCTTCGEGRRSTWRDACPHCGAELE